MRNVQTHRPPTDGWGQRLVSGLSSGEGLVWEVRDGGGVTEKGERDHGVADKRRIVKESEFASTLTVAQRNGNILSAVLRGLWDDGTAQSLTKNSPARTTNAHVSLVGHITHEELVRELKANDKHNGFANRFLFVHSDRSKVLPDGGQVDPDALQPLIARLRGVIEFAASVTEMERDDEARDLWRGVYPSLSSGQPGLVGKVLARGPAQVVRLSCIYALLDQSHVVRAEHLEAALAFWRYCEQSVSAIFGHGLSRHAERLLVRLTDAGSAGLARTDLMKFFSNNLTSDAVDGARVELCRGGFEIRQDRMPGSPGLRGRPSERWTLVSSPADEERPIDGARMRLEPAALHGLAGDVVKTIEPHTEADGPALLSQFLVALGNVVGRGPYYQVEATPHHLNLFLVVVGATSSGRKGTSWDHVARLFERAEQSIYAEHSTTAVA